MIFTIETVSWNVNLRIANSIYLFSYYEYKLPNIFVSCSSKNICFSTLNIIYKVYIRFIKQK